MNSSSRRKLLEERGVPRVVLDYRGAARDSYGTEHARPDCLSREGRRRWRSTGTLGACHCAESHQLDPEWGSVLGMKVLETAAEHLERHHRAQDFLTRTGAALLLAEKLQRVQSTMRSKQGTARLWHEVASWMLAEGAQAYEETFTGLNVPGSPERAAAVRALGLREENHLLVEISSRAGRLESIEETTQDARGKLALELYRVADRDGAVLVHAPGEALELLYSFAAGTTYNGEALLALSTHPGVSAGSLETLRVLYQESDVEVRDLVGAAEALSAG